MAHKDYLSVGDAIQAFLDAQGMRGQYEAQHIIEQWPSLMGAPVASNTEKVWYDDAKRILFVQMKTAAWRNELTLARTKIKEMVNRKAGREFVAEVKIV